MEYIVVTGSSVQELCEEVQAFLKTGYKLQGGVGYYPYRFCQALIRGEADRKKQNIEEDNHICSGAEPF